MSTQKPLDTSSISFTALYTGHTWVANGLSTPMFRTARGSLFYHALSPLELLARRVLGFNFRTVLLQRHRIIDHLLDEAISKRGVTQVLEIACGLSPRGRRFVDARPGLRYVEADLPEMARRKEAVLDEMDGPVPQIVPINIFADRGELSLEYVLEQFDRREPVAVITEGLVNYFELETIGAFWGALTRQLSKFPHAVYLTDTYYLDPERRFRWTIQAARHLLGAVARSRVSFHFEDDEETSNYLTGLNFEQVTIHNPRDYYDQLPIPVSRANPMVRVIEARPPKKCHAP